MSGWWNGISQMFSVTWFNLRTLPQRMGSSATAIFGIAGVVAVMVGVLSIAEGILRTMYDPRINLSNEVSMQLIEHFDRKVFRTVVPRNVRLAEAPSFGLPVLLHDRSSRGAIAYLALAGEVLRREDARIAEAV